MMNDNINCAYILKQLERAMGAGKINFDIIGSRYNIRYVDPQWRKVYGDPLNKKCYKYFVGGSKVCPRCGVKEAFKTKKMVIKEEVLVNEGGRPVQVVTVPYKDEKGKWLVAEINIDLSDIRKLQSSLRESEERCRLLFENNSDIIFIADAKTRRLIDCNKRAEDVTGCSRKKMLSMRADQLHPRDVVDKTMAGFKKMVAGNIVILESEILVKGKRRMPVEISATPLHINGKKYLIGIFRDITDRKKAEGLLEEVVHLLRNVINSSTDLIFVKDLKLRTMLCNEAHAHAVGKKPSDLYGKTDIENGWLPELVKGDPAKGIRGFEKDDKYALSGKVVRNPKDPANIGTEIRIFDTIKIPLRNPEGNIMGVLGVSRDISERMKAEEALRQSERRYRLLAEIAEDPIFIIGKTGIISYVNSFGAAYFSKKQADMIGAHISDFFQSKVAARMMGNIRKVFKTNKSVFTFGEFDFHGSKFWLDTRLSPLTDDSGKVISVMGVSRDMTSHRRAEEVLERDKIELEKLIKINSQKLLDSQKRLDRADRLAYIGTVAATVAHELRSPLAAIRIAAYNIKTKSNDPHLDNNIRNIEIKVLESDQIIKNLLLYSSIKSPIREKVRVCDLLSGSIDLAQSLFPGHKIRIRRILKCSYDMVLEADPVQLQEVFNNILNNSFESFRNKKGEIEVSASVDADDKFKIIIKDNGPGITREALEHIFEPFNSTKAGGTGLGLPVCKQIINLHKGSMDLSSRLGKGTTVTIRLPLSSNKSIVTEKSNKACLPAGREGM